MRRPLRAGGVFTVNAPAGGVINSTFTASGTIALGRTSGFGLEIAWGTTNHTPPASGWVSVPTITANGTWSRASTTRPGTAGTYWLWARSARHPKTVAVAQTPTIVTAT